jgi:hypothetical protein
MDKTWLITHAGGAVKVATELRISRQAVAQWPDKVPTMRIYQVRSLKPKWWAAWRREERRRRAAQEQT